MTLRNHNAIQRSILAESEPFFAEVFESRSGLTHAERHLADMDPARRAQLEAEWEEWTDPVIEARKHLLSLSPERRAQLDAPVEYV